MLGIVRVKYVHPLAYQTMGESYISHVRLGISNGGELL